MVEVVVTGDRARLISCHLLGFCRRLTRTHCLHRQGRKKTLEWNAAKIFTLSHVGIHSKEPHSSITCHNLIMGDSCFHVPTPHKHALMARHESTQLITDDAYQGDSPRLSCPKLEPWNRTLRSDVAGCQSVKCCYVNHWCRCLKSCSCRVVSMLLLPRRSLEVGHRWFRPNVPCPWVWHISTYAHLHTRTHTPTHVANRWDSKHSLYRWVWAIIANVQWHSLLFLFHYARMRVG